MGLIHTGYVRLSAAVEQCEQELDLWFVALHPFPDRLVPAQRRCLIRTSLPLALPENDFTQLPQTPNAAILV